MRISSAAARPGRSGRDLALLGGLAAGLVVAFVVVPGLVAARLPGGGVVRARSLAEPFGEAFAEYWSSGDRAFPSALTTLVDYWFEYHVAKGVIAALLLGVFTAMDALLWRQFLAEGSGRARRGAAGAGGVVVTMLAVLALLTVMANVQGAVAPFASLLPLLVNGTPGDGLADTLVRVRQVLAASPGGGADRPPALDVMVDDFARYHGAMVVVAAVVAIVLAGLSVVWWTTRAGVGRSARRTRRVLGSLGVGSALLAVAAVVIAVANTTTAADPTPALRAFFDGGW